MDFKRHWKKVLKETSRNRTLWIDTFIYESVESRKKENESNGSHFPRHHYWTSKDTGKRKESSNNQAETELYGSIRLYTNQLKA
jgi:hypothetical protein